MGQKIWVPIQRNFGLSCLYQVYYLHKSTKFCEIWTECQIIKNFHSFITVLLISHESPQIYWLITPWSLLDHSIIYPQCLPNLLNLCCLISSFNHKLNTWTLIWRYFFLLLLPLQWINLQKHWSLKIHKADIPAPTNQTFCHHCGVQRNLLVHIPPHKVQTIQTTTFIWVYFPQMTHQILTIKTLPKCFNQVNKLYYGRTLAFPWSIL